MATTVSIQYGDSQQTFLQLRGLVVQDLLDQVVPHMNRAAAHPKQVGLGILAPVHSQHPGPHRDQGKWGITTGQDDQVEAAGHPLST